MLSCKDMTKLISDSLEAKISVRRRMELWLHIMMCRMCRRFRSNILELRRRVRDLKALLDQADTVSIPMPSATKARLEEVINRQLG
ncbi:MAG: zf-HC2 domain-containing protein [Planctomycetota bacterium]|nr:zf-HC2 domain-containing protein [Planctomycetota bacterium]MDA1178894.1 zf-HC2 domain-containing protein [Planctomycetota bacterium]